MDKLADALRDAIEKLPARDRDFARDLLRSELSGRGLSAKQMFWAKSMIQKAGMKAPETEFRSVDRDIFKEPDRAPTIAERIATATDANDMLNLQNEQKLTQIIERVLGPYAQNLAEQNDERENALARRQDSFIRDAARAIADEATRRALKLLDERVPRETIIRVRTGEVTHTVEGLQHPTFEDLIRAATSRLDNGYAPGIMLAGEAGSGKTYATSQLAKLLGLDWHFNGAISFPHEMLGFIDAGGTYHTTPFRMAYEFGGVYTFDEVDRSDPVALLSVNPHLADGLATFPDKQIKRHKDCIIIATANTWGYGADAKYSGATKLDGAFLSRFPVKLPWDVDERFEERLVGPGPWYERFKAARNNARASGLKVLIDTRSALAGKALLEQGYSLDKVANMTYLANLKPEQRQIIETKSN